MPEHPTRGPRIRVVRDGPYLVLGPVPLQELIIGADGNGEVYAWLPGRSYAARKQYALCRCGQSRTMPYCEGSHHRVNFNGTETASRKPYPELARRYTGTDLDLTDAEELCASARFCLRGGSIWKLVKRSRHPEARALAVEEAANCPAGRLVVWDKEGNAIEPRLGKDIALVQDPQYGVTGPFWVRGGIPIESADGHGYEIRNRVALCRCGQSGNKPFCDGSHVEAQKPYSLLSDSKRDD